MSPHNEAYGYSRGSAIEGGLLIDLTDEAKEVGIEVPVAMTKQLAESLMPSSYLTDLGITLPYRIKTLLLFLLHGMKPIDAADTKTVSESRLAIPFMVVKGPQVREEYLTVIAVTHAGDSGHPVITLIRAKDEEAIL